MPPRKTTADGKEPKSARYTVTGKVRIAKTSKRVSKRKAGEVTADEAAEVEEHRTRGVETIEAALESVAPEKASANTKASAKTKTSTKASSSPKKSTPGSKMTDIMAHIKDFDPWVCGPDLNGDRLSLILVHYNEPGRLSAVHYVTNKNKRQAALHAGEMSILAYRGITENPARMDIPIIRPPGTHSSIRYFSTHDPSPDPLGRFLEQVLKFPDNSTDLKTPSLETDHKFIQHLFPVPEVSPHNPKAPVITKEVFKAFTTPDPVFEDAKNLDIRGNLVRALQCMSNFYGFQIYEGSCDNALAIGWATEQTLFNYLDAESQKNFPRGSTWSRRAKLTKTTPSYKHFWVEFIPLPCGDGPNSKVWTSEWDHNQMRISRILRSLRILGFAPAADGFWRAIKKVYEGQRPKIIGGMAFETWKKAAERPLHLGPKMKDGEQGAVFLRGVDEWELMTGYSLREGVE